MVGRVIGFTVRTYVLEFQIGRRTAALAMGRRLVRVSARQCDQEAATELVRILVAAIHEDYEAEILGRNEPDIGRRIVETAGFVHDDDPVMVLDLPGHLLARYAHQPGRQHAA